MKKISSLYVTSEKSTKSLAIIQTAAKALLIATMMWLLPQLSSAQSAYYFNGKGTADSLSSWGTNPDGSGTNPATFTDSLKTFYFSGNNGSNTVNLSNTFSVTGTKSKVVDTLGVNLIVPIGGLAKTTSISVADSSKLILQDTLNVKLGTLRPFSTIAYDGYKSLNILAGTYGNLISTNDSGAVRKLPKRTITIVGTFNMGAANFIDSGTVTFKAITGLNNIQHIPTCNFFNLTISDSAGSVIDSGAVVTINSGGKLTISAGDSLIIGNGGKLVYASKIAPTLTGKLHVSNGGTLSLKSNLAAIPAANFDSTSNLVIGDGVDSVVALPKLVAKAIYGNVTINAPSINSSLGARFIPNTAGTYNIVGDFNVLAGRVSNSNSGTKIVSKTLAIGGNLNINGGTYIVCDSTSATDKVKVAGDINVLSGALFTTNNFIDTLTGRGTISVQGDLIHSGGLLGTANTSKIGGKILFSCADTAGQAFSTIGFNNDRIAPLRLEVSGGNEVEVTSNVTVNDTLVLTLGYFTVTAGNTLTLNKGSKGQSDSSYIITDAAVDSATMGKATFNNIPNGKLFVMPIGNDSTYQPISVITADDSASFTAFTYNGVTKNGTTLGGVITDSLALNNLVNSTWHIQRNDAGKNPVTTSFKWSSVMAGSTFIHQPDSSISVFQNDGSGILKTLFTSSYSPSDSAVVTLTTFGDFMIGFNPTALPVKFIGVAASIHGNTVVLNWKVASELNMASYTIEKSSNGKSFIAIGAAKANQLINYTFDDNLLSEGTTYYRIKAVDKSGNTMYSPVVTVNDANLMGSIRLYPNPVLNGTLNVELTNQSIGIYQVSLVNAAGQVLSTKQINHAGGSSITSFEVTNLNVKGLCFVRILSNNGQSITKTVLIK